jgi:hypothetical protein
MKINVAATLQAQANRQAAEKPLPKIKVKATGALGTAQGVELMQLKGGKAIPTPAILPSPHLAGPPRADIDKEEPLKALWLEMGEVKRARGKLSTQTAYLVDEVEKGLRAESPALADEFLKGLVPAPQLAAHYQKIQALTDQAVKLFDTIRHVEQFGTLPGEGPPPSKQLLNIAQAGDDAMAMRHEIRRLDDLIYKTTKRLNKPRAQPSKMAADWRIKIALANARREEVKQKIKALQK